MLLVGVPHPNEPIGTLTIDFLTPAAVRGRRASRPARRHVFAVPVADPDGLVLNEGWFKGAFSPLRYALEFYRPPHREQVEWSFPVDYKTLRFTTPAPETADRDARHGARPAAACSTRCTTPASAASTSTSRAPARRSFRQLHALVAAQGLPLHRGEPEVPYLKTLAPAVYELFSIEDTYEYLARTLDEDPARDHRGGHLRRRLAEAGVRRSFSLVCELPYYTSPALEDTSPAEISRREAVLAGTSRGLALHARDARASFETHRRTACPITA